MEGPSDPRGLPAQGNAPCAAILGQPAPASAARIAPLAAARYAGAIHPAPAPVRSAIGGRTGLRVASGTAPASSSMPATIGSAAPNEPVMSFTYAASS